VPFVYGVQAYGLSTFTAPAAVAEPKNSGVVGLADLRKGPSDTIYGYAVRWTGMGSVRFLSQLLRKGVKVRFAEKPFQSGGVSFDRGTLLIAPTSNAAFGSQLWAMVQVAAAANAIEPVPLTTGFVDKGADFGSDLVRMIHKPRVAVFTGEDVSSQEAGEVWHLFEQEVGYPVTMVNASSAGRLVWKNFDVIILPNGDYRGMEEKHMTDQMQSWVKEGGRLIAMGSAVEQLSKTEWGIKPKSADGDKSADEKDKRGDDYGALRRYENRQREEVTGSVPGSIYRVELDNTHPLAFGYPDHYYTLKQDDGIYAFFKDGGWNVGVVRKNGYVSGFTGVKAREKIKDGLIFGVQDLGRGRVVYMADDPLFRSFWENGKLLFCNAVFLVGQ
jgi:hypothetical protein